VARRQPPIGEDASELLEGATYSTQENGSESVDTTTESGYGESPFGGVQ